MSKLNTKTALMLLKNTFRELSKNDPLVLAGATAFFTTFALPPIMIILILVLGLVFNRQNIGKELFERLESVIGEESVDQVIITLRGFRDLAKDWLLDILLLLFLLFVATTLFKVIKGSLNKIWSIRIEEKRSFKYSLNSRLHSIVVILLVGILFLAALLADGAQAFLGKYIDFLNPRVASFLGSAVNHLISALIVTVWFTVLFRYLPDGRPAWRVALAGGFITGVLFTAGKLLIGWLLTQSNITTLYGASGSLVLLLLFVFYSSLILYFGAAFTKVWGTFTEQPIKPLPHAVLYQSVKVDVQQPE